MASCLSNLILTLDNEYFHSLFEEVIFITVYANNYHTTHFKEISGYI